MAYTDGYTGDATNGIGQGLAFVLPQSNAVKYAMQLSQQHAAELRAAQQSKLKLQQQQEQQYQNQLLQQKVPEYWSKVGQGINDSVADWQKKAATYHATTGQSPFTNPDLMKQWNDNVLLKARQSKDVESAYTNGLSKVAADTDNKYTEDSKKAFTDWVANLDKNPTAAIGTPPPQLVGTPSGVEDFYKTIKPVYVKNNDGTYDTKRADVSSMMNQAYLQSNDPKWNAIKRDQYGIDPSLGDIGSIYNDKGKRVWYTNPKAVEHIATEILSNPTEPHNAEALVKAGIKPDDQYAQEKLQTLITKQNAGYGKLITDAGKYGQSIVSPETSRSYQADNNAMAHERMGLERQRFAWEKTNKDGEDGRDKFIDDLTSGNRQSRVELIKSALSFGGTMTPEKNGVTIRMPEKRSVPVVGTDPKDKDTFGVQLYDSNNKPLMQTKTVYKNYTIPDDGSDDAKVTANALLNHLDLFKKRALYDKKDNSYNNGSAPAPKQQPKTSGGDVFFLLNGILGHIPADKVEEFKKLNPNAVQQ